LKISEISSLDDIREYEKKSNIRKDVQALISPLKIEEGVSDEGVLDIIRVLKSKWLGFKDGPFVSEQEEYIYYLTKLEGKQRNKALGITDNHYEDTTIAKKWYKEISQLAHPDKGGDATAFNVLRKIYEVMVDVKEDENE
jgi:hypothetical protein